MAPSASKFDTLPFNCYELGHTWTPHCSKAAADVGYYCFKEGFKIYTSCYVLSLLASRRYPKSRQEAIKVLKDILRSSFFLTVNGVGFIAFFCLIRKVTGSFNFFTIGYVPAFIGSYIAILVEKSHRRPLLALYVANVASETIFRMLRARGIVRNIKNFDLFLFCVSTVTLLYQMKKGNRRNDIIDTMFTKIIGSEEFNRIQDRESTTSVSAEPEARNLPYRDALLVSNEPGRPGLPQGVGISGLGAGENAEQRSRERDQSYRARFIRFVLWMHRSVEDIACHLERMVTAVYEGQIHEKCPHKDPCIDYWLQGFWSRFLTGFGIQAGLEMAMLLRKFITARKSKLDKLGNSLSSSVLYPCVKSGLGLSAMCLTFRLFSCSFRWLTGTEEPVNAVASAIMASSLGFFLLKPPSTLGLYLFFKAAETVISDSHRRNDWKIIRWLDSVYGGGWSILFAASTAMLFHTGMLEPQNLKPSYYNFLSRVTGRRLYDINRHLMTIYETDSNRLMKDFWPTFDEKYISDHMKKLLKLRHATGLGNRLIKDIVRQFISQSPAV